MSAKPFDQKAKTPNPVFERKPYIQLSIGSHQSLPYSCISFTLSARLTGPGKCKAFDSAPSGLSISLLRDTRPCSADTLRHPESASFHHSVRVFQTMMEPYTTSHRYSFLSE